MADDIFTQAPDEVTRYFDAKKTVPSFDWRDVAPHEHAFSFTVAKSAGYDVLDDIRAATQDAIANYTSFGDFRDGLENTLRAKGWWGRAEITDPKTGELRRVQLGSNRRLRTIYWANTKTARAAGEWERIQRTKRGIPFLVYEQSSAEQKRPEHLGWVGTVLHVDHVWWTTHYPPNGWLCQCRARQITRREAEGLGYDPSADAPEVTYRPWTNKRTGETQQVPRGIDPGWQSNVGITRAKNVQGFLSQRLDGLPENQRRVAVADIVGSGQFKALARGKLPFDEANRANVQNRERGRFALPMGVVPDRIVEQLGLKTRVVRLSNADSHKQMRKRPDVLPEDYAAVQQALETGNYFEDATSANEFLVQIIRNGRPWHAVLHITKDRGELFLKSFRRIQPKQMGANQRNIPFD